MLVILITIQTSGSSMYGNRIWTYSDSNNKEYTYTYSIWARVVVYIIIVVVYIFNMGFSFLLLDFESIAMGFSAYFSIPQIHGSSIHQYLGSCTINKDLSLEFSYLIDLKSAIMSILNS
ncbi:unnamed protein product (mitochondrion) [Musa textilis]